MDVTDRLDAIVWKPVEMVPTTTRHPLAVSLDGVVSVGRPTCFDLLELAALDGEKLDGQVSVLARENDFRLIRLPISIRKKEGVQLRLLKVEISLTEPAYSWSMDPQKVEEETKVKVGAKLSSGLKLAPVSLSSTGESSEEYTVRQPRIEAYDLGRSISGWEFNPIRGCALSGIQILTMVAVRPRGVTTQGVLRIAADVYQQSWLLSYRARDPSRSDEVAEFVL